MGLTPVCFLGFRCFDVGVISTAGPYKHLAPRLKTGFRFMVPRVVSETALPLVMSSIGGETIRVRLKRFTIIDGLRLGSSLESFARS